MNDFPGRAVPGPSPSDGERPGAPDGQQQGEGPQDGDTAARPPAGGQKWSAEQPPPGEWQSPGAPQPARPADPTPAQAPQQPAPGPRSWASSAGPAAGPQAPHGGAQAPYGTQYGRPGGPGYWGKPPAAKPGTIPLRPLDMGEILDGAVATMRGQWRSVLSISLVVATIVQVVDLVLKKYALADLPTPDPDAGPAALLDAMGASLLSSSASLFVQFIGGILATALLTMVFSRAVLGRSSTVAEAWRDARPRLPHLVGLTLLLGVAAAVLVTVLLLPALLARSFGLALLGVTAAIPLLLWLGIKFSLASPALMLEKSSIPTALRRSSKLVHGSWWRIFGITALTALITGFVSAVIIYPLAFVGAALSGSGFSGFEDGTLLDDWTFLVVLGIASVIAQTITLPMQSGVTVLLYVDQRIRREALDLELARAAGLENYGTDATATVPPTGG
ncbi:glycerophosphoryl diester phosphodiesterase membrane domain-containing protein [Streptomyces sp. NPDC059650]|uniref:glycerophosphoryl diester phosphodiesterase membrane domain-containing protein n=1 Tax=Streptomyces sp. NPDC059650 TaxID=3346896 RepID=UPI003695038D